MAELTGEINAIRCENSGLLGCARDPVSVGRVVDDIWPDSGGEVVCRGGTDLPVRLEAEGPGTSWDARVAAAAPGALIVNATGLGKDRRGSPVSEHSRFPRAAVVWELNYRGDLGFLSVAERREEADRLSVHDGWQLFCHGWAAALTSILGLVDEPQLADQFAEAIADLAPTRH